MNKRNYCKYKIFHLAETHPDSSSIDCFIVCPLDVTCEAIAAQATASKWKTNSKIQQQMNNIISLIISVIHQSVVWTTATFKALYNLLYE